jgi:hypothetical protein
MNFILIKLSEVRHNDYCIASFGDGRIVFGKVMQLDTTRPDQEPQLVIQVEGDTHFLRFAKEIYKVGNEETDARRGSAARQLQSDIETGAGRAKNEGD